MLYFRSCDKDDSHTIRSAIAKKPFWMQTARLLVLVIIKPSDRFLAMAFVDDLGLDRHVSNVCKTCFFWHRYLRRVRRSLDIESVKTLVHPFVTSRVDYCNSVLSSASKMVMDKWQSKCCMQHVWPQEPEIRAWSVSADP